MRKCWLALLLFCGCHRVAPGAASMRVWFLDVGQGVATLFEIRGRHYLLDVGPDSSRLVQALKRLGVDTIDGVWVSHRERDHCGGLVDLATAGVVVRHIWVGPVRAPGWCDAYIPVDADTLVRGDTLPGLEPWRVRVLWPPGFSDTAGNGISLVISVAGEVASGLWPGDIGWEEETSLRELERDLHAEVLSAAHHGSRFSNSLEFLGEVSPRIVLIGVGNGNSYGHPSSEALERLALVMGGRGRLWRTDQDGEFCMQWRWGLSVDSCSMEEIESW